LIIFFDSFKRTYEEQNESKSEKSAQLLDKYRNCKSLVNDMTVRDFSKRPDCRKILEEKHLWVLNRNEFDFSEDLRFIKEHKNDNQFVYSMIISKLQQNIEK
jgi:hypothetical protein